jgi:uncharacterized protein
VTNLMRRAVVVRALPFAIFMALLALRGGIGGSGEAAPPGAFDARWLYAVQTLLPALVLIACWRDYGELSRQLRPTWRNAFVSVLAGLLVFVLWIQFDAPWMTIGQASASFVPLNSAGAPDWPLIALRAAGAVLIVPLMEELFWRSFVMRWVDDATFERVAPNSVSARAIVVSTFAFVLVHTQWLAAAFAGLVYAGLYVRSGSLWTAVLAHAITNAALAAWVVRTQQWHFW